MRVQAATLALSARPTHAQEEATAPAEPVGAVPPETPSSTDEPRGLSRTEILTIAGVGTGLSALVMGGGYLAWWRDAQHSEFKFYDSGFLRRDTYAGGADKLGHVYSVFVGTRMFTQAFMWAGINHRDSVLATGAIEGLLSFAVEFADAYNSYGFEFNDVIADYFGIGMGFAAEFSPAFDALVGYRLSWVTSSALLHGKKDYIKIVNDYSGQMYFLDFRPAGLEDVFGISPGWARYFILSVTHSTNGYSPKDPPKQRKVGVAVGLNVPEILRAVFGNDGRAVAVTGTITKYVAVPFTNVGWQHGLNFHEERVNFGVANRLQL